VFFVEHSAKNISKNIEKNSSEARAPSGAVIPRNSPITTDIKQIEDGIRNSDAEGI